MSKISTNEPFSNNSPQPKDTSFFHSLITVVVFVAMLGFFFLIGKIKSSIPPSVPPFTSEVISVQKGNTLQSLLSKYHVPFADLMEIITVAKHKIDLEHLKIGQEVEIKYTHSPSSNHKIMTALSIKTNPKERVFIEKVNQKYQTRVLSIATKTTLVKASGVIIDNVITSALRAKIPLKTIMEVISYYNHQIDFERDLRIGDRFSIIYEILTSEDDKKTTVGKTLFANLILSGKNHKMYKFKLKSGFEDFFDENSESIRRPLMKTPVQSTRISSRFGIRKHPILGYSILHRGVDFAASPGTPIYAAGNGTVVEIGFKGTYGRYIKIRHNADLSTAYAHARSFAKDLKKGSKVSQGETIAYVGASGRVSGPHLHYEVIHKNRQVDPLKFKVPSYIKLKGEELEGFRKTKEEIDNLAKF